jgi:hypothetical protein
MEAQKAKEVPMGIPLEGALAMIVWTAGDAVVKASAITAHLNVPVNGSTGGLRSHSGCFN